MNGWMRTERHSLSGRLALENITSPQTTN